MHCLKEGSPERHDDCEAIGFPKEGSVVCVAGPYRDENFRRVADHPGIVCGECQTLPFPCHDCADAARACFHCCIGSGERGDIPPVPFGSGLGIAEDGSEIACDLGADDL